MTPSHSPSPSPSASAGLTTVFEDLIHTFVKSNDGYTYGFGNTGCIYRRDTDGFWLRIYKDQGGAIKGAAEWYTPTKTYLYWATDNKLHRKEMPGRVDWNDVDDAGWPKDLNSADWHTMREAGGALMIANGPWLAMVGYDESYTNEALDLIPGNLAKTIVERNGRTIVGCSRNADPDRSINGAIDSEVPLAQVGDDGDLVYANMTDTIPVKQFPGGGKVNPGGVTNEIDQVNFFEWEQTALSWISKQSIGNMSLWAVYGATTGYNGIYSYGRKNKNHPFVMNLDYLLEADELGALIVVDGTVLVSYRDGTAFGVKASDPTTKATGVYEGLDLASPIKKPGTITTWKYAEVYCRPLPDGAKISFSYRIDKDGDFVSAKMEGNYDEFRAHDETKAVFLVGAQGDIFEPKIILEPISNVSAEILRIKIFFD